MEHPAIILLDEHQCHDLELLLVDRIYEFNSEATGYFDGKLIGGSMRADTGAVIAGFNGHTWGGCCEIQHLWVDQAHRGQGLGRKLLQAAEAEAARRGCHQLLLSTHSFQAPEFYERMGYGQRCTIADQPRGHASIIYVKLLQAAE